MKEIGFLIQRATRYLKSAEILLKEKDYESFQIPLIANAGHDEHTDDIILQIIQ